MARKDHQAHRPIPTRRVDGRGGEAGGGGAGGAAEAAGGDREHRWRRGEHRGGPGGEVAGGRVHAVPGEQRHGRPEHAGLEEAPVRSDQGPGAGVARGGEPDGAGGASLGAREERDGAGGVGEGEAGHAQFRLEGREATTSDPGGGLLTSAKSPVHRRRAARVSVTVRRIALVSVREARARALATSSSALRALLMP